MKKVIAQALIAIPLWLMLGSVSFAMCIWFVPPSRQFAPATNIKTLIVRDQENHTFTVQPQFSGNATDFALVMPFPSEPTVNEAPEEIFTQLENLTNPVIENDGAVTLENGLDTAVPRLDEGVEIIEVRDVGDYTATTLSASDATSLTNWLRDEGYEMTPEKMAIVGKYVDDGSFFVALKVNMDAAEVDAQGFLQGELNPVSFEFTSQSTTLPLQLMAGDNDLMTLTVYTICDEIVYIPGAEVQYSKKIDSNQLKDFPALESYNSWQKWLVRNVVQFNPAEVETDLNLLSTNEQLVVVPGERPLIVNPDKLPAGTGILVSENGDVYYSPEQPAQTAPIVDDDDHITTAVVIILAISNVVLLLIVIAQRNEGRLHRKRTGTPATKKD